MDLIEFNLLQRFSRTGDEEAFAFLVERYGPLVLGVCRRQSGDAHLAEDAFQATFLVLARRAGQLDAREPLGNWLFGVAVKTARQMRTRQYAREKREQKAAASREHTVRDTTPTPDAAALEPLLDSALEELPPRLRQPLVLCTLQGRTYEQAATELQLSHDTVRGRIAQARERLRSVLERRGVVVPAAVLLSLLGAYTQQPGCGSALVQATARASAEWSRGAALKGASIETAQGVLREMSWRAAVYGWGAAAGAAALLSFAVLLASPKPPAAAAAATLAAPANRTGPKPANPQPAVEPDWQPRLMAPLPIEAPARKKEEPVFDLGEGTANLLMIADVALKNVEPGAAAQILSKQFNVNIHFTEAALEGLQEPVTLELQGLTGIEILNALALKTKTDLKIEDGRVFLALKDEPKNVAQTPAAVLPPKAPGDF